MSTRAQRQRKRKAEKVSKRYAKRLVENAFQAVKHDATHAEAIVAETMQKQVGERFYLYGVVISCAIVLTWFLAHHCG